MSGKIKHSVERTAFEKAVNFGIDRVEQNECQGYVEIVNAIEQVLKDGWRPEAYEKLRAALGKDGKWTRFLNRLVKETDRGYLKGLMMSFIFEGALVGYRETRKRSNRLGMSIPWIILFDPTSACNLHCVGCWASEYGKTLNLSYEDMNRIICEGKELGIHEYIMTGGEPLVRKKDIIKLAKQHSDCGFMIFTNGTLVDQDFCNDLKDCGNILLSMSIEGFEEATDSRRGQGVFKKVMDTMDLLRTNGIIYGTSICYTRHNCEAVTSDDFLDFLVEKGVSFSWYFHYMPVGMDASAELIPTVEQRKYIYRRIREVRAFEGGKPIFLMDFQNDGEFVSGCIAGGKYYCHINPNGDVEPCVFIHYSNANIHEKSLLECLKQPLFRAYQHNQPFNDNLLRPCPMLENPLMLRKMVAETGAHSTDLTNPESCEHLCSKCDHYADVWQPMADLLWEKSYSPASKG